MSDRLAELGPLIDAGPTREHLARLQSFGLSVRTLHRLSGVSMKSLASLIWGVEGREPSGQVRQETADRIMAVRPRFELLSPVAKIGVTGTQRRVQALQVVGWSPLLIAADLSATAAYVSKIARGRVPKVKVRTAIAVKDVYERLWAAEPPQGSQWERTIATRIRRKATRYGWAPPMAWDDETIDDPAAEPEGVATSSPRGRLPQVDELAWLMDQGETPEAIAMRFNVHVKSLKSAQIRAHRRKATA